MFAMFTRSLLVQSGLLLFVVLALATRQSLAAAFYIPEAGSPASLGTGGVANPTNTFGAASA
ncbi:MAG: hypothetical protein ACE5FQ_09890 [Thiogranum sp.]